MECDLVMFLEPYIDEVTTMHSTSNISILACQLSTESSIPHERGGGTRSEDAADSFLSVYNNLIAPSRGRKVDGATPLLALPLAWVVMCDDELFLKEKSWMASRQTPVSSGDGKHSNSYFAEASAGSVGHLPIALPMCGTCLSRVKGELSGLFDGNGFVSG